MHIEVMDRSYVLQLSLNEAEALRVINQITKLFPAMIDLSKNNCEEDFADATGRKGMSQFQELLALKDKLTLAIAE